MTSPNAGRVPSSVLLLDGKPYQLVEEEQARQLDGVKRRWDVRRVTRQQGDPEPEFSVPLETFNIGSGISYSVLPGGYESADGWDLSAPGKALTWPRLSAYESFEYNYNTRGWEYYSFATNYLYVFRAGYAIKYEPNPTPGSAPTILEIHYFGADRVVSGKWAEFDGKVYVPLVDPTDDSEQEFAQLTTINTPVTEVQTVVISGTPTAGTYRLTYDDGVTTSTTSALAFNASGAAVQAALRLLPGLQKVTVVTTGSTPNFTHTITMTAVPSVDGTSSPAQMTHTDNTTGGTHAIANATTVAGVGDVWTVGPDDIVARYFAAWNKPGVGPVLALCQQNLVQLNGGDPMSAGDWGAEYPVDNSTYRCTSLAVWDRFLMVGKQNGLYSFDEQAVAKLETKDLAGVIDDANFVGMVEAGGFILAPHKNGLLRWQPGRYRFVGAEADDLLEGEIATGWGRYVGVTPYGRIAYTSVTDYHNSIGVVGSLVAPGSQQRGPLTPHMHQQFPTSAEDIIASTIQSNPARPDDVISGADLASVGTIAWTNPNNIATADAAVVATGPGTTHYLKALMPAVTRVPADATVDGIEVTVDRKAAVAALNTGATSPGTGANLASIGTNPWTNPGNITSSDNAYATNATAGITQGLRGSNYGLAVPTLATILGIKVEIEKKQSAAGAPVTAGPTVVGTGATIAGANEVWANPSRITASDASYATAVQATHNITNPIAGTNLGFAVPTDATVLGITFELNRYASAPSAAGDWQIQLTKSGSTGTGTNKATGTVWPTSPTTAAYGGAADLWGTTWTPAEINASTFGALVASTLSSTTTVSVDFFQITVTYQTADGIDSTVKLVGAAGTVVGDNKASASAWPTSDAYTTYGGAADLWGTTWTPADVNDVDFGAVISASVPTSRTLSVDHVRITVYYSYESIVDNSVRLVVGGSVAGSNLADAVTLWPTARTAAVYGGPTELWGLTPTAAQVNAADFGFVLSAVIAAGTASLYGIAQVRVFFTAANGDPGAMLLVIQVNADGVTAAPNSYQIARSGLTVSNDPNISHAISDASLRSSRIFQPSRNTQKTWRSVEFHAGLDPETNTPGAQMWASVDNGTPFALLDEDGNTLTADASGDYEAFFPDSVDAIGRWVQLIPTVPALAGGEVAVSVDLRDITLHGSFAPKMTDYVTAVMVLKDNPKLADGTTDRRTAMQQYSDLLDLCGPRPSGSGPIALHDPETGEDTTCMVTGEPRLLRVQFQNQSDPSWVAIATIRKTPRARTS